ncbi:F0F1 ATP synthase subunit delta [Metasolibacillus sp. FSL H7-0170]|uniref:F0F1 ATP synthase subunit delta n=1 Tax=Metasolibacillus TaxID=2703677 RepID=UPI000792DD03|nr:F0F1 ATP synthase subunit delta [Metasolibacillus fluoroglycofenilyticus]KYG90241.1 ATP synthase F0F1 subunit delta [[Bacillus] sp. KCTC 13219]
MSQVAKRYAEALFQLASKEQSIAEVSADLKEFTAAIEATPALLELLKAPKISSAKKKAMLSEILANANSSVLNTVQLLVDKQRINDIVTIAKEFQNLATAAQGAVEATVYSTRALTEAENAEISAAFATLVGKSKLDIKNIIEPSILGGIRVQIGNYIYDSTIASKLEGLKRTLVV